MSTATTKVWELGKSDDSRFRGLVDSVEDYAIFMLDLEGRVCSWNLGAAHIKGYTKEEVLGQHFSIFYSEAAIQENIPAIELDLAARSGRYEDEGWRRRKDGSQFWAYVVITGLYDRDGVLQGYAKITRDMSERKRLEERFRRVVESAPNAMVMANRHGHIEMVNAQAEKLFGYPRPEMLGQIVEVLVPARFRHGHPEKRALFFGDPQSRPMGAGRDLFGRRKDGSEFPVEIALNPIETEEGMMVLSSIVDISDRKQKEGRIQAALKEKDLLLGEIHHRVKNNLQIVHSLLNLQSSLIDDPAVKSMLMDSQNRIQSMALIHQTLYQSNDFAKVDFGGFLEALAPTLIASYGIDAGKISLSIDASAVYLPINSAIPCGLLINELITNSLKHGFPDGRCGEINLRLSHLDNKRLLLAVSDTGVGIPDDLDIDHTETLGLRLVSLLSRQLEGTLSIQRRQPTRFLLEFPLNDG
ncbi:MAG: PAS domain S-box protein [Burkholderiales bacterium]|nr:PAS domain S-box protein [Burkholderiales bacterium]